MIVLDTNVVAESRKLRPDTRVLDWLAAQPERRLCLTATVVAELAAGIALLPRGRRRIELQDELDLTLATSFVDSVLPFDLEAAHAYALVHELRRMRGRHITTEDAQIAAVCLVHDAALATRNTRDFEGLGLTLIDPWQA